MSLFSALSKYNHLSELNAPLEIGGVVKSAATRRALAIANLFAGDSTPAVEFPDTMNVVGAASSDTSWTGPKLLTATNVGTAGALCVAEEHGDGLYHTTKLTCTAFAVGTGGDAENLAIGAICYTFPAGAIEILGGSVEGIFDQASHGTITGGEVALGTTTGTGAVAVTSTTMEDIFDGGAGGVLSTYVLGTTRVTAGGRPASGLAGSLKIPTATATRDVYLNIAAAWPNIAAAEAVTFTGTVTIQWKKIS